MKTLLVILLVCFSLYSRSQFVHPGMLHNKRDLEFLKARVLSGKAPWASLWSDLKAAPESSLDWKPKARDVIVVGFYSKPDIGATDFERDGDAAYTMALQYYVTKEKAYADKTIEIINAWSYTLDSITDGNKKLLLGIAGIKYLNAAEIIRYTYKGWKKEDQQVFNKMLLTIWYPLLQDFMPTYNGNWDAAIAQTMMCIGIFCDRKDIFERAYAQCLNGKSNGAINNYFYENGQCQESGRDQGHAQMGLGFLTNACEIAWKQGYDLYAAYNNRLATGYEYTAKYLLGEEVPYSRYINFQGKAVFGDTISSQGRSNFYPIYERVYHHYHDRLQLEMPYTGKALEKSRSEGRSRIFVPWASLTTTGFPVK